MNRTLYIARLLMAFSLLATASMLTVGSADANDSPHAKKRDQIRTERFAAQKQKLLETLDAFRTCVDKTTAPKELGSCRKIWKEHRQERKQDRITQKRRQLEKEIERLKIQEQALQEKTASPSH